MVRGFQEKAIASDLAARSSREVERILASRFSLIEQLEGLFVCAVTGHDKTMLLQYFSGLYKNIKALHYCHPVNCQSKSSQGVTRFWLVINFVHI